MNFNKGVVTVDRIMGIPVNKMIIEPAGKVRNVRSLISMVPEGITVHNTGNKSPTACDINHGRYLSNLERSDGGYVSWHFTVDKNSITQHIPINEVAYHAGDGRGFGNRSTIGIEIAENDDYAMCEENGVKLIVWLLTQLGLGVNSVEPHRKYSSTRKLCPHRILKNERDWVKNWEDFRENRIKEMFTRVNLVAKTDGTVDDAINIGIGEQCTDIKIGDTVRLKEDAIQWDGRSIRKDYRSKEYKVKSIDNNKRTVLERNNKVMYAVHLKHLIKDSTSPIMNNDTVVKQGVLVRVNVGTLNIRNTPNGKIVGQIRDRGVYTITNKSTDGLWGRLKSGIGWIHLDFVDYI